MHAVLLALALAAPPETPKAKSPLDDMIASALKNHPDVKAAEAKKLLAEAELEQARLLITQKVSAAASRVELAKAKLVEAEEAAIFADRVLRTQGLPEADKAQYAKARPGLLAAKAELAAAELELQLLVGKGANDSKSAVRTETSRHEEFVGKMPSGPVMDKLEAVVMRSVTLSLKEIQLADALPGLLKAAGGEDIPVRGLKGNTYTFSLSQKGEVTFGAALEMLMDEYNLANPGSRYEVYVREYGLLLEKPGGVAPKDAPTLTEFIRAVKAKKK